MGEREATSESPRGETGQTGGSWGGGISMHGRSRMIMTSGPANTNRNPPSKNTEAETTIERGGGSMATIQQPPPPPSASPPSISPKTPGAS